MTIHSYSLLILYDADNLCKANCNKIDNHELMAYLFNIQPRLLNFYFSHSFTAHRLSANNPRRERKVYP